MSPVSEGADPEQLHAVGTQLTGQAERADGVRQQGGAMLRTLHDCWAGPDLEAFDAAWPAVERSVGEASATIRALATALHRNADEQTATSEAGTGVPGTSGPPGGDQGSGGQRSDDPRWDEPRDDVYGDVDPEVEEAWDEMSDEERDAVLDQIIAEEAERYGISPPPDITYDTSMKDNEFGSYNDSTGRLKLNPDLLDDPQMAINTIVHEMRHAGQHEMVDDANPFWPWQNPSYPEGTTPEQIQEWEDNFDDYKSTDNGDTFEEYWEQPVEVDAREHSRDYVNDLTPEQLADLRERAEAARPDPSVPQPTPSPTLPGPPEPTPEPTPPSPQPGPSPTPTPTSRR